MDKLAKQLADGITAVELVGVHSEEYRAGFARARDAIVNGGIVDDVVLDLYGIAVQECVPAMRERDDARMHLASAKASGSRAFVYAAEGEFDAATAALAAKIGFAASLFGTPRGEVMEDVRALVSADSAEGGDGDA